MRTIVWASLGILLALLLVATPAAAALEPAQVRALVRVAVKTSGLSARKPVRVVTERPTLFRQRRARMLDRTYPKAAQAHDEAVYRALGLLAGRTGALRRSLLELERRTGLYDPVARIAYVQAGRGERAAALHEVVHALQDQHYDLRRLTRLRGDAARAARALVEGHATLVADVLARRGASVGGPPLTRFLELQRGFVSTVGLRFAADLRNLGGNRAVLGALRRLPATSEQVFHLDKYLEQEPAAPIVFPVDAGGSTLTSAGSFGELDVRALLAVFAVPRLDRAANGWGGGRTARYRGAGGDAVLVALDWDTEVDAAQWADAVATYVDRAFDPEPGAPVPVGCAASACWQVGARGIAFERAGRRSALAIAGSTAAAAAVTGAVLGRP